MPVRVLGSAALGACGLAQEVAQVVALICILWIKVKVLVGCLHKVILSPSVSSVLGSKESVGNVQRAGS